VRAQCACNDAGIDDAVWRGSEQDTSCPCGPFAEAFDVAALYELAQPVLPTAAAPDLREHRGRDHWP